jgi:hypothetical protein
MVSMDETQRNSLSSIKRNKENAMFKRNIRDISAERSIDSIHSHPPTILKMNLDKNIQNPNGKEVLR